MYWNRIIGAGFATGIGAGIGYSIASFLGMTIGAGLGIFLNRRLTKFKKKVEPENKAEVERAFFDAVFPLLGHLAKADGRISEEEISSSEQLIRQMGLSDGARIDAINLFRAGAKPDFDVEAALLRFMAVCGSYSHLRQVFLVYLITLAYADNHLHDNEESLLYGVAERLGYSRFAFSQMIRMINAQSHFFKAKGDRNAQEAIPAKALKLAYQALGVEKSIDDASLKKTYRKLMSEYHPDKLAGSGVPEEAIKVATDRSQEIQTAYALIRKHRKK